MKKMKLFLIPLFLLFAVSISISQDKENCTGKCDHSDKSVNKCNHKGLDGGFSDTNKSVSTDGLICPVSKETIEPGKGIELSYLGKIYTFCCQNCIKKFSTEPLDYIKEEVSCVVMGEPASKDSFAEYNGMKYYFCCPNCIKKFNKDPDKYLNKFKKEDK
jgi:YHS domain-containing protein